MVEHRGSWLGAACLLAGLLSGCVLERTRGIEVEVVASVAMGEAFHPNVRALTLLPCRPLASTHRHEVASPEEPLAGFHRVLRPGTGEYCDLAVELGEVGVPSRRAVISLGAHRVLAARERITLRLVGEDERRPDVSLPWEVRSVVRTEALLRSLRVGWAPVDDGI